MIFMEDLASRLANRVQLTSDGHKAYLEAVEGAFGSDIDYAMLVKLYGPSGEGEKRYSPAECIGAIKHRIEGNPDPKYVSTSFAERSNLNMRMHTRRFTRLTNAFLKKIENHAHSVALFAMYYNLFVSIRHCELRSRWPLASRRGFGRLVILWMCWRRGRPPIEAPFKPRKIEDGRHCIGRNNSRGTSHTCSPYGWRACLSRRYSHSTDAITR